MQWRRYCIAFSVNLERLASHVNLAQRGVWWWVGAKNEGRMAGLTRGRRALSLVSEIYTSCGGL